MTENSNHSDSSTQMSNKSDNEIASSQPSTPTTPTIPQITPVKKEKKNSDKKNKKLSVQVPPSPYGSVPASPIVQSPMQPDSVGLHAETNGKKKKRRSLEDKRATNNGSMSPAVEENNV